MPGLSFAFKKERTFQCSSRNGIENMYYFGWFSSISRICSHFFAMLLWPQVYTQQPTVLFSQWILGLVCHSKNLPISPFLKEKRSPNWDEVYIYVKKAYIGEQYCTVVQIFAIEFWQEKIISKHIIDIATKLSKTKQLLDWGVYGVINILIKLVSPSSVCYILILNKFLHWASLFWYNSSSVINNIILFKRLRPLQLANKFCSSVVVILGSVSWLHLLWKTWTRLFFHYVDLSMSNFKHVYEMWVSAKNISKI